MTKRTQSKLAFFHSHLVPTGQVTELVIAQLKSVYSKKEKRQISTMIFETLGLVSAYVIRPTFADNDPSLTILGNTLDEIKAILQKALEPLSKPPSTIRASDIGLLKGMFNKNVTNLPQQLQPLITLLLATIRYTPETKASWLATVLPEAAPLVVNGKLSKWRTFVKNLNFEENLKNMGYVENKALVIPYMEDTVGVQTATTLWHQCFDHAGDSQPISSKTNDTQSPTRSCLLPPSMVVTSNNMGLLRVQMPVPLSPVFKQIATNSAVPASLKLQANFEAFDDVCDYLSLAAMVTKAVEWRQDKLQAIEGLELAYTAICDKAVVDALKQKLQASFTKEELALLASSNALGDSIKPSTTKPKAAKKVK